MGRGVGGGGVLLDMGCRFISEGHLKYKLKSTREAFIRHEAFI